MGVGTMGALPATPSRKLIARLLVGTLVPTVAALGVFGVFAHEVARERLGGRGVMAVAADLTGRGDTAGTLALGAAAYELGADKAELERARAGVPAASPLFVGHDGLPYKRAYAAIGEPGALAGFI